ncbi:MAG: TetR family transcriptional regulator [Arachnia sp.]
MNTIATDGRTTRWEEHNANRRRELVQETLRAIRRRGAGIGMDELATEAGTSKTVFYRHFGDRAGVYHAVCEAVHDFILRNLPLDEDIDPAGLVRQLADSYLALVERDPEIYQFVLNRPSGVIDDPVVGITTRIGNAVSEAMGSWLRREGLDDSPANTWGHGVVGFVYAVADRWIITRLRRPRADVVAFIAQLFDPAFSSQTRSQR